MQIVPKHRNMQNELDKQIETHTLNKQTKLCVSIDSNELYNLNMQNMQESFDA